MPLCQSVKIRSRIKFQLAVPHASVFFNILFAIDHVTCACKSFDERYMGAVNEWLKNKKIVNYEL